VERKQRRLDGIGWEGGGDVRTRKTGQISTVLAAMVGLGRNYFAWGLSQALHGEIHIPDCDLLTLTQYVIKCR